MPDYTALIDRHRSTLDAAIAAVHGRQFFAHWPEAPSGKIYGETAQADGEAAFKALLGSRFEALRQDGMTDWEAGEESPYGFALEVEYPVFAADTLVARGQDAFRSWSRLAPAERAALLVEALEHSAKNFFLIAFATMHTTGQGFVMSFQASGPHAWDRALEAVALGLHEQTRFPQETAWDKPMGKVTVSLRKKFRAVGRGVGVVIGCSTFPVWNSFPAIFANLVTGNTVLVKPHPKAVLPIAVAVADIRASLAANGIDPDVIQLAVDGDAPLAFALAQHPDVALVDYTGNSAFGEQLEHIPGKIVFTEKAGVNSVILDSVDDLDAALDNLAFSVCLYSGQMCTTPQNIFLPRSGVREKDAIIPYEDVARRLTEKITALVTNSKMGPGTLGALQNPATLNRLGSVDTLGCDILLPSSAVAQPGFEGARSYSPAVLEVPANRPDIYLKEMFGPIVFLIPTENTGESIEIAAESAARAGAITFAAYSTDAATMDAIEDALLAAGAPVSFNLTGPIWVNQAAAFSDFHVSGGNPAGNASLVDPAFLVRRFFFAGSRRPA
jgi:phenylacetic acid degradation protein paaN